MDELMNSKLEPGETILWQGKPEKFVVLDGDDTVCDSSAFYAVSKPEELKKALSGVLTLT